MNRIVKTDSDHLDYKTLVDLLDEDLDARYGEIQKKYTTLNKLPSIKDVYIVYVEDVPVGCGAYKIYTEECAEIKRVFVKPDFRQQGIAKSLIQKIVEDIKAAGFKYVILETGVRQPEAIGLYQVLGFAVIENYGPYIGDDNSVCMKKML